MIIGFVIKDFYKTDYSFSQEITPYSKVRNGHFYIKPLKSIPIIMERVSS